MPPLQPQNAQLNSTPNLVSKSMLNMVFDKLYALFHATQIDPRKTSETTHNCLIE